MKANLKMKVWKRNQRTGKKYWKINHKYKDRLFRYIFSDKKSLLQLYNVINGTSYQDVDELKITTIDNIIYVGMKNDISFMISGVLNLYEHQSSINPNMPLRGLLYFAALLEEYIRRSGENIYGTKLIKLPKLVYLVFYNGEEEQPDRQELRLSDAFEGKGGESNIELKVTMLNINIGHNKELLEECTLLKEYAQFVNQVRCYKESGISLEQAVDLATEECIENGILTDILGKNRAEVKRMILTEGTLKNVVKMEKADGIRAMVYAMRELEIPDEKIVKSIVKQFHYTLDKAKKFVDNL